VTVIEIPDDQAAVLKAKAAAQGLTLEAWFKKLADEGADASDRQRSAPRTGRHIGEMIRERMSKVPPDIMASMPKDGASEHDHYIYGLPKRNE
jgi:hypothetical protein